MKPGVKTSEFWVSLIAPVGAIAGIVLGAVGITVDTTQIVAFATAIVSSSIASHGYSQSRATVKAAVTAAAPDLNHAQQGNLY